MKATTLVALSYLALAAGCATSSGITPSTQGDLSVSVSASPAKGGAPAAQRLAREEATEHCAKDGKQMEVITEVLRRPSAVDVLVVTSMSSATVVFKCVP